MHINEALSPMKAILLQVLAKANILSAPLVVENGLEDSGSPTFRESGSLGQAVIGWIDVADLVAALLSRERRSLDESNCAMLRLDHGRHRAI